MAPPPAHRATTANLGAAYPFVAEPALACRAPYIGRDLLGGSFSFDPFELYAQGSLTSPNALVVGQIGRGKSALVKTYLWRQSLRGCQAWVIDPKGEYAPLARAWGVEPLRLAPGGPLRLNPLDRRSSERRRSALLISLAEAGMGRGLRPAEVAAIDLALAAAQGRTGGRPLIGDVVESLFRPDEHRAAELATRASDLAADGREVALVLRRLVSGDLKGMFDAPTTKGLDVEAPLVVLDLSAVYGSPALGALMACAMAWVQAAVERPGGRRRLLVLDEAWAVLSNLGTARWLQATWKLSRAYGLANLAVVHRLSDLRSSGPAGSEQSMLAEGLLSDSETRIVYAQPPGEAEQCRRPLGLTGTEVDLLPRLGRGVALWKVGRRAFLVEHRLSPAEVALVDTDQVMRTDS